MESDDDEGDFEALALLLETDDYFTDHTAIDEVTKNSILSNKDKQPSSTSSLIKYNDQDNKLNNETNVSVIKGEDNHNINNRCVYLDKQDRINKSDINNDLQNKDKKCLYKESERNNIGLQPLKECNEINSNKVHQTKDYTATKKDGKQKFAGSQLSSKEIISQDNACKIIINKAHITKDNSTNNLDLEHLSAENEGYKNNTIDSSLNDSNELNFLREKVRLLEEQLKRNSSSTVAKLEKTSTFNPSVTEKLNSLSTLNTSTFNTSVPDKLNLRDESPNIIKPKNKKNSLLNNILLDNDLSDNSLETKNKKKSLLNNILLDNNLSDNSFGTKNKKNSLLNNLSDNCFIKALTSNNQSQKLNDSNTLNSDKNSDNDSDWEGLDGERDASLSKAGIEIQKLLKQDPKSRVAHSSNSNIEKKMQNKLNDIKKKETLQAASPLVTVTSIVGISDVSKIQTSYNLNDSSKMVDQSYINEEFSGLRIIKPEVSSEQIRNLMRNRRMIKLSSLHSFVNTKILEEDWVTIAVIVSKMEQKVSAKGKNYSIWNLSDLSDCQKPTISCFLFDSVNLEHWKTPAGSVVGLLNPSLMNKTEKSKSSDEISITIDNPRKLLKIGISFDLGVCRSKTKSGNHCTKFINKSHGEFCVYHIQAAYKKQAAKRSELQSGFSGCEPKFKKQMDKLRYNGVNHGGESFTSRPLNRKPINISINSLLDHHAGSVGTTNGGPTNLKTKVNTLILHDLIPPNGHVDKVVKSPMLSQEAPVFHELLTVPSVGSMNFVQHLKKSEGIGTEGIPKIKQEKVTHGDYVPASKILSQFNSNPKKFLSRERIGESASPKLGLGLNEGSQLVDPDSHSSKILTMDEKRMMEAVKRMKEMGGLKRENPNSIKKDKAALQERVKRKLSTNQENAEDEAGAKRKKLIGNVDLQDENIQRIINAKSKHEDLIQIAERQKEDEYFEILEKSEKLEEAMIAIKEVDVMAVSCNICKYTALSVSDLCREQNHRVTHHKAKKRFFACKSCKKRTITLHKMPIHSCRKCGGESFERVGMKAERKGQNLPWEDLLLRGEERKFINS